MTAGEPGRRLQVAGAVGGRVARGSHRGGEDERRIALDDQVAQERRLLQRVRPVGDHQPIESLLVHNLRRARGDAEHLVGCDVTAVDAQVLLDVGEPELLREPRLRDEPLDGQAGPVAAGLCVAGVDDGAAGCQQSDSHAIASVGGHEVHARR